MLFNWLIILILIILWLIGVVYLFSVLASKLARKNLYVPFIPADIRGLNLLMKYVTFNDNSIVYDVGSGWGTAIFYFAKRFATVKFIGVEINPILHLFAILREKLLRYKNTSFCLRDAALCNYKNADIIFVFMLPIFLQKVLLPILEKDLKKGAIIISYVFPIKSSKFTIEKMKLPNRGWKNKLYIATKK